MSRLMRLLLGLAAIALQQAIAYSPVDQYSQQQQQHHYQQRQRYAPVMNGDWQVARAMSQRQRAELQWGYAEDEGLSRSSEERQQQQQWEPNNRQRQLEEFRRNNEQVQAGRPDRPAPATQDDRQQSYEQRLKDWQRAKEQYEQRYRSSQTHKTPPAAASRVRDDNQAPQHPQPPTPAPRDGPVVDPRVQEYIRRNTPINLRGANVAPAPAAISQQLEQRRRQDDEPTPVDAAHDSPQQRAMRLPVSARIIIRNESNPLLSFRQRAPSTIRFAGYEQAAASRGNDDKGGSQQQAKAAAEAEYAAPSHCVWAIVVCCRAHAGKSIGKLGRCFEATECLAVPWDEAAACEPAKLRAANHEIRRFYLQTMQNAY